MQKIHKYFAVLCILICVALVGCSNISKRDVGTVAGGVGGGILGSSLTHGSTAGTIGGALGGAYIGNQLTK